MTKKIQSLLLMLMFFTTLIFITGCTKTSYTVKFDLNYQNSTGNPADQTVEEGMKATEPMMPVRDGYEFIGWFKDSQGTDEFDFASIIIADITLYAKWEELEEEVIYYLGASFTNYSPNNANFKMIKGENNIYTLTVQLTAENRDTTYDGHYYKVTDGTWTNCWGIDNYYIKPAPLSPTGGGLGSIWHWANGTLTVTFDATTKNITDSLVMSQEIIEDITPSIYGEFNNWAMEGNGSLVLNDNDNDGIYTGMYNFTEAKTSDFTVVVSKRWYDDQWGQRWGAEGQYKLDGTAAGMGNTSSFTYEVGRYLFEYDSITKVTTITKVVADYVDSYIYPRIYGEFNSWDLDGTNSFVLKDPDNDGIFTGNYTFTEAKTSDFTVVLSRKWYDDQWGQRWGAEIQYKLDGTAAGMGNTSSFTYEAGLYLFEYNSYTKVTTITKVVANLVDEYVFPRIYGEFNTWDLDGVNSLVLADGDKDGIYTAMKNFSEGKTSDFTIVLSRKWYDDQWGQRWGAEVQYKLDGTAAGMGNTSSFTYEAGLYLFEYNSFTKVTTITKVVVNLVDEYVFPRIYGKFNGWDTDGNNSFVLLQKDGDLYKGTFTITTSELSDYTVVLSRKWYDDQWGQRWGAEVQYKLDGTLAGFANVSELTLEAGVYEFTYNALTHVTTYIKK